MLHDLIINKFTVLKKYRRKAKKKHWHSWTQTNKMVRSSFLKYTIHITRKNQRMQLQLLNLKHRECRKKNAHTHTHTYDTRKSNILFTLYEYNNKWWIGNWIANHHHHQHLWTGRKQRINSLLPIFMLLHGVSALHCDKRQCL